MWACDHVSWWESCVVCVNMWSCVCYEILSLLLSIICVLDLCDDLTWPHMTSYDLIRPHMTSYDLCVVAHDLIWCDVTSSHLMSCHWSHTISHGLVWSLSHGPMWSHTASYGPMWAYRVLFKKLTLSYAVIWCVFHEYMIACLLREYVTVHSSLPALQDILTHT